MITNFRSHLSIDMFNFTYRILSYLFILNIMFSCDEPKIYPEPEISFIKAKGCLFTDTSLMTGDKVKVMVKAVKAEGALTYLNVSRFTNGRQIVLDSGLHCKELFYTCYIEKSVADTEIWVFKVMDKFRMKDSICLTLFRASGGKFSSIKTYQVTLGAQNNVGKGSFLNFSDSIIFNLYDAFNHQNMIDLVYYYGQYESTLASPAETDVPSIFTGTYSISNWTIKNETRYLITLLTPSDFNQATNDSLLITAYDVVNAKKKAKYLKPNMIVSFQGVDKRKGLIKVKSVNGKEEGDISLEIKIQE